MQIDDHWLYSDKTPQMAQSLNTSVWNEQNDSKSMLKSEESFSFTIFLLHICKIENTLTLYKCLSLKVTHNLALYNFNLFWLLSQNIHIHTPLHILTYHIPTSMMCPLFFSCLLLLPYRLLSPQLWVYPFLEAHITLPTQ